MELRLFPYYKEEDKDTYNAIVEANPRIKFDAKTKKETEVKALAETKMMRAYLGTRERSPTVSVHDMNKI
jgi:hypothetical protein